MKLVIFESESFYNFFPIAYLRPTFELRCGHLKLYEKIIRNHPGPPAAFFCRHYLAETFALRAPAGSTINDPVSLDDNLLVFNGQLLVNDWMLESAGEEEVGLSERGEVLYARIKRSSAAGLPKDSIHVFLRAAAERLPSRKVDLTLIRNQWELIQHNSRAIVSDFELAGKRGVEGWVHDTTALYGPTGRLYIAREAEVQPGVVIDTRGGPVTIESGSVIFPQSRIEGPCYLGPGTQIFRGHIREGCSFGPVCRVGGEVEESIIQGYSNKYHDGFLGHAYLGEWVNLGAMTTNSDLKNDYNTVEMYMQDASGKWSFVNTGDSKVGCFIGDHTKTSIGTLLNTGSHIGVMTLLMADGRVLPKFIPSFSWFLEGAITGGFGLGKLLETAVAATGRRSRELTAADRRLLEYLYELTKPERSRAIKKDRKKLLKK
ncbi:MAG: hypothetical protein A3F83_15945 [Candidatus Glassbacteria bacterium RIFCSPLOWO2_12_FULL_58_11]|uniref:Glucose-1-phosphate thymidylyltransferase n=1 Tax=Candidatus Glassbacteria bacterium RIFCSPLOWO2_12_FULL_58_11 TaxID=1817867 RepID=A0A1F5YRU1_9BACT|nr:MAG: hypothetical protein A3F83_15945 [Candidatus Glassbacteria bacterium RIFCSPLOWO2_12_FULL_58_11]